MGSTSPQVLAPEPGPWWPQDAAGRAYQPGSARRQSLVPPTLSAMATARDTAGRTATIRDVAADAGVAASTVSNVLSGRKRYPDPTVQRVLASVTKLGYRPSSAARALALGRTNILGMLADVSPSTFDTDVDIFMRFVRAAMYTAQPRGYDVLVMGRGEEELEGDILADAMVVMDIRVVDPRIPVLLSHGLPTVLIGVPPDTHGLSAVDLDFAEATRVMVRHLAERGHREIAVLAPPDEPTGHELAHRHFVRTALVEECARHGISGRYVASGSSTPEVVAWFDEVRSILPSLTGIIVTGISALDALLAVLTANGLRVPADVSVIALAPDEQLALSHPTITTLDLPGPTMVRHAVDRALDELTGSPRGVIELIPPVLLDKGSTAAAPAGAGH